MRAYVAELLPGILDGSVDPGKVLDRTATLDEVPAAYRAMDDRKVLKALIAFSSLQEPDEAAGWPACGIVRLLSADGERGVVDDE